jgi:PAS domain S-box-containing protein
MTIPDPKLVRILHLEDNLNDREIVQDTLDAEGLACIVHHVDTRQDFEAAIDSNEIDVIVSDHALPSFDGATALTVAHAMRPDLPFIFFTGSLGDEFAVEKMRNGATDYVLKHRIERLAPAIRRALNESAERHRREQAEEHLRRSDELFRQITDNIHDLIAIFDCDGRRVYNSASYGPILGDDGAPGAESFLEVHPEDRERVRRLFDETVATGAGWRTEYRLLGRDGTTRLAESEASVIRDAIGHIVNVMVVAHDITERRRSEQHIREQAALLEVAHDAIYVRDLNQSITYWNSAAEQLYGWPAKEVLGRRADELLYRGDSPLIQDVRRQVLEKGVWTGELKQFTRAGTEVTVLARRTLLLDVHGKPRCILNINTDITEKKLLQEQLLRTQRMESIGALAGGIAHDLNNVLAPILMAADLLRDEVTSESGRLMLDTMKSSAQRGSEMVKQILSFARGTGNKYSVLQAGHLLTEMARLAKDTFPQSINIKTQIAKDLAAVNGNATHIHQVLLNLCVNARDAMPAGGTLRLGGENMVLQDKLFPGAEAPVSGTFAVLSVADTGEGIPPHLLATIFEPFFTTKGEGKGTGIGLSTVRKIVTDHGGQIEVTSRPGAGSCFRIYLPAAAGADTLAAGAKVAAPPQGNGELILLMDDELALLEITKGLLESYNYRVLTAPNGADALVLFHQHAATVRAVITDLMTPIMDGAALIRVLRQIAPHVKVIAVSGQSEHEQIPSAECTNVHACLTKPYSTEQILIALHDALAS